jgi:phage terminase large subunit GpA-like protein
VPAGRGSGCAFAIYTLAAPVYLLRGVLTILRFIRLWRISRLGYVDCPHCGEENAIDVLTTCPRCKTTEYGNRLRCTGCGMRGTAFACDECGVTIHCL